MHYSLKFKLIQYSTFWDAVQVIAQKSADFRGIEQNIAMEKSTNCGLFIV